MTTFLSDFALHPDHHRCARSMNLKLRQNSVSKADLADKFVLVICFDRQKLASIGLHRHEQHFVIVVLGLSAREVAESGVTPVGPGPGSRTSICPDESNVGLVVDVSGYIFLFLIASDRDNTCFRT